MDEKSIESAFRGSDLIVKYLKGELTENEQQELDSWIDQSDSNRALFSEMTNPVKLNSLLDEFYRIDEGKKAAKERLDKQLFKRRKVFGVIPMGAMRYVAAAAIIGVIAIVLFLYTKNENSNPSASDITQQQVKDLAPGDGNQVMLTLADGSRMPIDSAGTGLLTQQGSTEILKNDGRLIYHADKNGTVLASNNSIETPKGKRQELVLPDGSRVWLNALSKLDYPTAFNGKDRSVSLSGEAYFDIVKDKSKPFHVNVGGVDLKVTGTQFNINAYKNEAVVRSTLFEGGVKISKNEITLDLAPGQQLQADPQMKKFKIVPADLEATAAWKNGVFYLDDTDVSTLMREAARWYDIEVEYPNGAPQIHLVGELDRNTNLSELIKVLNANGIKTRLEGKTLLIFP